MFIAMVRKAVIDGETDGDWYGVHAMDGSGSLRYENSERNIFCCASSKSRLGVEVVAPTSEAFRAILAVLLQVELHPRGSKRNQ